MTPDDVRDVEDPTDQFAELGNVDAFTRQQLLSLGQVLLASNRREGLQAIQRVKVDNLYSGMLVPLDEAAFTSNQKPQAIYAKP